MSKIDLDGLSSMQFDVLKELGNIGAGNATTAVSNATKNENWISQTQSQVSTFTDYFKVSSFDLFDFNSVIEKTAMKQVFIFWIYF